MKRPRVERHLTAEQARGRYLSCGHPVEKSRWHAVWLLLRADEPRSPAQVAGVLGLAAVTVRDGKRSSSTPTPANTQARAAMPKRLSATTQGPASRSADPVLNRESSRPRHALANCCTAYPMSPRAATGISHAAVDALIHPSIASPPAASLARECAASLNA